MRHLSNIYDHREQRTRDHFTGCTYEEWRAGPQAIEQAWKHHLEWVNANVIGRPQATPHYTVDQLEAMGMIGIYAPSEKGQESAL